MDDIVRVKVRVSTRYVGSEDYDIIEFDREDWETMSEAGRNEVIADCIWSMLNTDWEVLDETAADSE